MRLDRFLSECGICSRKDAAKAAAKGTISVNGAVVKDRSANIDPENDTVTFDGKPVKYSPHTYIMMNKPAGVVSSTEDRGTTVIDLLPDSINKKDLFPAGRLDKNTVGLMLITNDGELAHFLLSPKRHVAKTYNFKVDAPLDPDDVRKLENGVDIGFITKPAKVELKSPTEGRITITEGKYHQIRLMMHAVGTEIIFLERISMGSLILDPALERGSFRPLTAEELSKLKSDAKVGF